MDTATDERAPEELEAKCDQILKTAGLRYHDAHGPYLRAVAAELQRHGLTVTEMDHHRDDPRSGFISVDARRPSDEDDAFLAWDEETGWTHAAAGNDGRGYGEEDLDVSMLAPAADVAAEFLIALGRDVLELPSQWQSPTGYVDDVTGEYRRDFSELCPDLERSLVAYVGYPGAEKWPLNN
jgi:hypothetical protein